MIRGILYFLIASACSLHCQLVDQSQLDSYLNANRRFGFRLLDTLHTDKPEKNIVISPLPLTFAFTVLSHNISAGGEFYEAFGGPLDGAASHMLATQFRRPQETKAQRAAREKREKETGLSGREELWSTNTFWYSKKLSSVPVTKAFISSARFDAEMDVRPAARELKYDDDEEYPHISEPRDFWIKARSHLRTSWSGNLFSGTRDSSFTTQSGESVKVKSMRSELGRYRHFKNDDYEAVVLFGYSANLVIFLPSSSSNVSNVLERFKTEKDNLDIAWRSELGVVDLPRFTVFQDAELRPYFELLGIKSIFHNLEFVNVPRSHLSGFQSKVEIVVNESGMRADAAIVMHGVVGESWVVLMRILLL